MPHSLVLLPDSFPVGMGSNWSHHPTVAAGRLYNSMAHGRLGCRNGLWAPLWWQTCSGHSHMYASRYGTTWQLDGSPGVLTWFRPWCQAVNLPIQRRGISGGFGGDRPLCTLAFYPTPPSPYYFLVSYIGDWFQPVTSTFSTHALIIWYHKMGTQIL